MLSFSSPFSFDFFQATDALTLVWSQITYKTKTAGPDAKHMLDPSSRSVVIVIVIAAGLPAE